MATLWGNRYSPTLLVDMEIGTAPMEKNLAISSITMSAFTFDPAVWHPGIYSEDTLLLPLYENTQAQVIPWLKLIEIEKYWKKLKYQFIQQWLNTIWWPTLWSLYTCRKRVRAPGRFPCTCACVSLCVCIFWLRLSAGGLGTMTS